MIKIVVVFKSGNEINVRSQEELGRNLVSEFEQKANDPNAVLVGLLRDDDATGMAGAHYGIRAIDVSAIIIK